MAEIHYEISELLHKQMNAQIESLKKASGVHTSSRKPTKKCAMKMKVELEELEKNGCLKYFLMEGRVYKALAENSCHGYQTTSDQQFFIH